MRPALAQGLRAATIAGFVLFCVLLYRAVDEGNEDIDVPATRPGELSVADIIHRAGDRPLTARGHPFLVGGELRLCHGLLHGGGEPARCVGPYLILEALDPARVDVEGHDEVAVSGVVVGTVMRVEQLLS